MGVPHFFGVDYRGSRALSPKEVRRERAQAIRCWSLGTSLCLLATSPIGTDPIIFRWISILTLRRFFTANVAFDSDHQLVKDGLYRILRHPSYSGSLISFLGLGLAFSNWCSFLVIAISVTAAFLYRIHVEERALKGYFGEQYTTYAKQTKRIVPFIY